MNGKRAFISYQRSDAEWAKLVAESLERYGVQPWWDHAINPGDNWRDRIAAALEESDVFIVLHSAAAEGSAEVQKEIGAASALKKPLLALRLEDRAPKGVFLYELAALSWVDAFRDPTVMIDDLARRLSKVDLAAGRQRVDQALDIKPFKQPRLSRLLASNAFLLMVLAATFLINFATLNAVGLGYSSLATEAGATISDLGYSVGAALVGPPILVIRFALSPPSSAAEWVLLASCIAMLTSYFFLARNLARSMKRMANQRAIRPKEGHAR